MTSDHSAEQEEKAIVKETTHKHILPLHWRMRHDTRDASHPLGATSFSFTQFLGILEPNNRYAPLPSRLITSPRLANLGSVTTVIP